MSTIPDRHTRRRLATRQAISDAATRLFLENGFDHVTVDEIAEAADVGRMTVFNHFPRKEDMFFDRDEEGRAMLRAALRESVDGTSPIETLRRFAHELVEGPQPYLRFFAGSRKFVETVEASETLMARARAIRDEFAQVVAASLAECSQREPTDADTLLAANLLLSTWSVAFVQAHRIFRQREDASAAKAVFLDLIDKGTRGIMAAMINTPYA
ncbi:TetR family transcriptional regulator [Neoasaia chiangmaiensis NBRC 101099]|uniref:TetR family transcriptional regulator n=1 Tax=Neoasaia chiangmaiensis TaxID=320497 RepID=A0A1U9KUG6_9PROT|nr:TetR/AcrR family transcriptional regulator [Neoasaia chiangmaiensis]AQS89435.1 TetR family transcriptional regulator [Neoasaia chiangmaiensis]GBR39799.1 TetR family transcriptional regulator [Neoasaia chiangmaiensis NBRC 101099]GEN14746.1 TetR family transcriptional regulator [Neoasaia chiangmaiensis]